MVIFLFKIHAENILIFTYRYKKIKLKKKKIFRNVPNFLNNIHAVVKKERALILSRLKKVRGALKGIWGLIG